MTPAQHAQHFRSLFEGKLIDVDGWYGSQCWDLAAYYAQTEYGCPTLHTGNGYAYGVFLNFAGSIQSQFFDLIVNNPNDPNQTAPDGAIIIWTDRFYYPAGHIAIKTGGGASSTMQLFEQDGSIDWNYDGNADGVAYITYRGYANVAGWLVPKEGANMKPSAKDVSNIIGQVWGIPANANNIRDYTDLTWDRFIYHMLGDSTPWMDRKNAEAWNIQRVKDLEAALAKSTAQLVKVQASQTLNSELEARNAELIKTNEVLVQEKVKAEQTGGFFLRWIGDLINKLTGANQ